MWGGRWARTVARRGAGQRLETKQRLRRDRQAALLELETIDTFASGIYIEGLGWPERSRDMTVAAVTKEEFVIFDGYLGTDSDPSEELGRIPRNEIRDIRTEDLSSKHVVDYRLVVEFNHPIGIVANATFKFVQPGTLETALDAYRRYRR